uniref:NADH-ubiquinone oxidoreductase chain 1 n=1 Tax=Vickermania ingenoplastis TaxID=2720891 RepID=A0A872ZM41_9TRYP|nr:NADH dehydrogenase subunit 2 [Vickermania ingenoplastis]UGV20236.1 NADH dehydrogenase subunit 1 [Vickermania ingenoplastis]
MVFYLDIYVILVIIILVILILSGFVSLCERRIMALVQIRIGPALFMFGLLTPITDGLKLFLKFALFVVSVDIVYLIGAMFITAICIFVGWLFFPLGFIILLDNCFTLFILLLVHTTSNLFSVFFIGCFLFTSCFVYLAAMRTMLFSIVGESSIFLLFLTSYLLDYFSYLGIKDICVGQLYINNSYIGGVLFLGVFWVSILLDGLKLPFDYFECESELVAGLVTEFSGIFFVIYSVLEIGHLLLSTLLFACICFGGLFICFKSILILIIGFFYPRVIGIRLKITTAQIFIIFFFTFTCIFLFCWLSSSKLISCIF